MIATIPDSWLPLFLPAGRTADTTPVAYTPADPSTLRQRLADTVKGRRGEEWACWRRAVLGERLFRIRGGPGSDEIPLVFAVDEFISKKMLWGLATVDDWYTVPPDAIGQLLAPSLSILRADVASLGAESKWDAYHVAEKWLRATEKVGAERASSDRFTNALEASLGAGEASKASPLPWIIQSDDRYRVLVDDDHYEGPVRGVAVVPLARQCWSHTARVTETPGAGGAMRPMHPSELVEAYGHVITSVRCEYAARAPRVEGLTLIEPPQRGPLPVAARDADVEAWLVALDPSGRAVKWIAFSGPQHAASTCPALAIVGESEVGKGLFAGALAASVGQHGGPTMLHAVLQKHASELLRGPVVLGDEGLPRNAGKPMTEEFRTFLTTAEHAVEMKGVDKRVAVVGGCRVVLGANRIDRLFSSAGGLNADDVAGLVRRLCMVDVHGANAATARRIAISMGSGPSDPERLRRVAGHFRWIQDTMGPSAVVPDPFAGSVSSSLRTGGDLARTALDAIEDAYSAKAPWIAVDAPRGLLWYRPESLAIAAKREGHAAQISRALEPYRARLSAPCRRHPITRQPHEPAVRWGALSLPTLLSDSIAVGDSDDE